MKRRLIDALSYVALALVFLVLGVLSLFGLDRAVGRVCDWMDGPPRHV